MSQYDQPHLLLPFLDRFLSEGNPHGGCRVRLRADGCMDLTAAGKGSFRWSEQRPTHPLARDLGAGWLAPLARQVKPGQAEVTRFLARRLRRLLRGQPPLLLQFRNRNPQRLQWGPRLFRNLCPGLVRKDRTRYFDYLLCELVERGGEIVLVFRGRPHLVELALTLDPLSAGKTVQQWRELRLVCRRDERPQSLRRRREHQVEHYLAYLLSRNLPPRRSWQFDFDDPPPGYLPADVDVDLLRSRRLDDSAFFEMLFASPDEVAVVASCDRECFNLFGLAATPRESWTTISAWQGVPAPGYLEHCCHVGLDTRATVTGHDRLADCLQRLAGKKPPPEAIVVFDSCLHRLIGSDVGGTVERLRRRLPVPLLFYDIRTTQHPYLKQWRDFWLQAFKALRVDSQSGTGEDSTVALLGCGGDVGELAAGLRDLGIDVRAQLFPGFSVAGLRALPGCRLIVRNDWEYCRVIFQDLLQKLDRPCLALPLPFGSSGTVKWLRAIYQALHPDRPFTLPERLQRRRQRLRDDCRALAGTRVALVTRGWAARQRLSSRLRFGVPLIEFFHDLGLGVDVNLFVAGHEEEPDPQALSARLGLSGEDGDSLRFFHDARQLSELLKQGDFQFVYTERFHDDAVLAAGKAPLHLHRLRPGLAGALATVRHLRGILDSGFYQHHARWLVPARSEAG